MPMTRRFFVGGAAGVLGTVAVTRPVWPSALSGMGDSAGIPTAAGRAFAEAIGPVQWTELRKRLPTVNADIREHGLRDMPGVEGKLLTGYPYNEFYDWDLSVSYTHLTLPTIYSV